jgi:hypothetical protein
MAMNDTEREALGRAIARVIDQRMAEMHERVAAVESQLADVPAAIERCAPAEMVEALRQSVDEVDARNGEALHRAQSAFAASLGLRVDGLATRLADTVTTAETHARDVALGVLTDALREQGEHAAAAIERIKDQALDAWARVASVKDGEPGPRGRRGEPGPPGSLAQVRTWTPGEIYRAGEFVWLPPGHPHGWAMACATEETFEIPGDDGAPWEPHLFHGERGQPGQGMRYRGRHVPGEDYQPGDVCIGDAGSAWIRTEPGVSDALPGDGWGLLAKRGERGTRGKRGEPGGRGVDGVGIAELSIEGDALLVLLTNGELRTLPLPMLIVRGAP